MNITSIIRKIKDLLLKGVSSQRKYKEAKETVSLP
jgi:hypothetical protein